MCMKDAPDLSGWNGTLSGYWWLVEEHNRMKVIDEPLLAQFRTSRCEWCRRVEASEPHHVFARGMGGGSRLDVRVNLISLCRSCHNYVHAGMILRIDLLAIVARREGTTQDRIEEEVYRLRRTPK